MPNIFHFFSNNKNDVNFLPSKFFNHEKWCNRPTTIKSQKRMNPLFFIKKILNHFKLLYNTFCTLFVIIWTKREIFLNKKKLLPFFSLMPFTLTKKSFIQNIFSSYPAIFRFPITKKIKTEIYLKRYK